MRLDTERLRLCPWEAEDHAAFAPIATNPAVMRYINLGEPWTDQQISEFIARQRGYFERFGYCLWKLLDRSTGRLVGMCGLQPVPEGLEPGIEIGWWLAEDVWGQGLATEAAAAAAADGFERCGLDHLSAYVMHDNAGSRNVMDKLGMTLHGEVTRKGVPVLVYGTSREQWWNALGVQLETPRLLLCRWKERDWQSMRPLNEDPEVMRYINHGVPWTVQEHKACVERQRAQFESLGYCYWKLLDRATHRVVGFCGVQPLDNSPETEIGWRLVRECWGRGYATEAAVAAMDDVFRRTDLPRVVALAMEKNTASRHVMEKLGMAYERNVVEWGMEFMLYSIAREKWTAPGVELYAGMERKRNDS